MLLVHHNPPPPRPESANAPPARDQLRRRLLEMILKNEAIRQSKPR